MTFEYIVDKQSKKLTKEQIDFVSKSVTSDFKEFDRLRSKNTAMAKSLSQKIFFDKYYSEKKEEQNKYERWKTKVDMCKVFMFYQVLKSFIWKNTYSNTNSMFDVSGENQEADNDSNKQKAGLVNCFEKMDYQKTMDKVIDNFLIYGELITYDGWKKKSEEYRRQVRLTDLVNPKTEKKAWEALRKGQFFFNSEKNIYDNPYVSYVDPENFVFDISQKDNWDDCPKIYRSFKTADDIINNKFYNVSKEVAEELKGLVKGSNLSNYVAKSMDEVVKGKTIEVLEHWGNISLEDGTILKNYHTVVVAGKHLVRFDKNRSIINPFNFGAPITDPNTQRGISPLYCTLPLAELQEDLMNRTCDMQTLQENPPIYAPEGFFEDDEIKLYPGKIIEYGDNLNPVQIKQMEFAVSVFLQDITFLSDLMAETSGIFPNMAGADEQKAKTATEINTKAQGQLTRLSMLIDYINQYIIVEDVKKVAKLRADFKQGIENILIENGTEKEMIAIDDTIRQAEYRYKYADRTATTERSNKADLTVQAMEKFAQFIPLNVQEIFTWYMEQKDVENPERFLQTQNTIPLEVQQQLLQDPKIQAICEAYQQGVRVPSQAEQPQPNNIPDAAIPQAGGEV
jgi:hypothetical protein